MKICTRVVVTGVVQGVNFRYYTKLAAERLGVLGWVRNLPDGSVEGCFEGEETAVSSLVAWCHRGPDSAHVDGVEATREEYCGEYDSFTIRR